MEAVKAMKEGKKVRRSCWTNDYDPEYYELEHPCIVDNKGKEKTLNLVQLDATDWEIFDEDKDWVLAEQNIEHANNPIEENTYFHKDVKKCRDLVLKDLKQLNKEWAVPNNMHLPTAMIIVGKRFGDLE